MVYSKHTPKSRKYKKNNSYSTEYKTAVPNSEGSKAAPPDSGENTLPSAGPVNMKEKKSFPAFGFLNSLFGSDDRAERSDKSLFNILGHDICLDDLLLVGLILLLLTDKMEDEILLLVLAYLLLDII
ncbi:hypothetical protein LY28_01491 [Ruminiclostridium sufflavum DSM 19573]|uniref:Uncharacterized protein n=1 Tax=Ruminiclostridium sufflavum DSM 19573 TaxID=1121337 RepID=A0A318XZ13_9FIRM|nr:hypothetical protein [Ruminiclostridium sufflavum]PYG88160.1 hypothetical protein LY28_01491 [Ruminiclostridium sufflavum DSM 19573]